MTITATDGTATLLIHICNQRRAFRVTFSTEAQAIDFLSCRTSTHNWEEIGTGSVPAHWTALLDFLYPVCEHGLSLDLCYGLNHYMSVEQEEAMGWQYADAPSGF